MANRRPECVIECRSRTRSFMVENECSSRNRSCIESEIYPDCRQGSNGYQFPPEKPTPLGQLALATVN